MPHAVVRPDMFYAWSGPSLLVVNTRGECAVDLRVVYSVRAGSLDVRTIIANRARTPLHLTIAWTIDADYTDIQEAEASRPKNHHLGFKTRIEPEDALTQEIDLSPQQVRELPFRVWPSGTVDDLTA